MESEFSTYQNNQPSKKETFTSNFVEFAQTLVIFLAIGFVTYLFIAQPHKVSGPSMYPTFKDGDYIISDKVSYLFSPPKQGDVIVFKDPMDLSIDFIKRVIGTPGDKIEIINDRVYSNGKLLPEKYLAPSQITEGGTFLPPGQELTIPPDEYLVFGDNRIDSSDSRQWGYVKRDEIIGKVILRYWPPNEFGINPGAAKPRS